MMANREPAYQKLQARIIRGELAPGWRLAEEVLAKEFGISRTPIREALFQLQREGLVTAKANCGFAVAPLSGRDIREIYPIMAELECLALRSSGMLAQAALPELEMLNAALAEAEGNPAEEIAADAEWHETLLRRCPNKRLREMASGLRPLTFRYEYAFREASGQLQVSVKHHELIAQEIAKGEPFSAAEYLRENWMFSQQWLLLRAGEIS